MSVFVLWAIASIATPLATGSGLVGGVCIPMAKWRAIYGTITTDEAVIELSDPDQLLYERMIVKADDWGIITGSIKSLKLETIPGSSRTLQEIDGALQEMAALSLIWRYHPEGHGPLIQIVKFDDHQPNDLIRKRTDPKLPLHPDWRPLGSDERGSRLFREMARNGCLEESRVDKSREEKSSARERDPRLDHQAITGYKDLARLHVPVALRDDWIACAEEIGTERLLAFTKQWIGNGWNKQNVNGIMEFARKGGEGKGSKRGKHSRRDSEGLTPEEVAQYFPEP